MKEDKKQLPLFVVPDASKEEKPKPEKKPDPPYVFYVPIEFRNDQFKEQKKAE